MKGTFHLQVCILPPLEPVGGKGDRGMTFLPTMPFLLFYCHQLDLRSHPTHLEEKERNCSLMPAWEEDSQRSQLGFRHPRFLEALWYLPDLNSYAGTSDPPHTCCYPRPCYASYYPQPYLCPYLWLCSWRKEGRKDLHIYHTTALCNL